MLSKSQQNCWTGQGKEEKGKQKRGEMGRREKHVWRGRIWKGIFASLGCKCRLRGCKRQADLYVRPRTCTCKWMGREEDDEWESEGMAIFMQCSGPSSLMVQQSAMNDGLDYYWRRELWWCACTYSALVWASIRLVFSTITWMKPSLTWLSLTKSIKHCAILPRSGSFVYRTSWKNL